MTQPAAPSRSPLVSIIKWTLFLIVLGVAGYALRQQFQRIDWSTVHFRALPLLLSAVCLLLVPPVQLISYRTLLGAYAHTPSWKVMAAVAWVPPLGKYIPGASWVGAFYLLRKFSIPAAIGLSVIVAMDGLAVLSGLIVGSACVGTFIPNGWIVSAIAVAFGLICLHPKVFGRLLNFVLIRTKRQPLDRIPHAGQYVIPLLCAFTQWVLAGMALWLVTRSVADVSTAWIPRFFCIAGLGYSIGYLVLFAPAGLGPRDLIFQKATQSLVTPAAMSAVAVVVMRIIQTLTELFAAMIGMIILRQLERESTDLIVSEKTD